MGQPSSVDLRKAVDTDGAPQPARWSRISRPRIRGERDTRPQSVVGG